MGSAFVFLGSDPSDRRVTFSRLEQPHNDELTFIGVQLDCDGLTASCSTESLDGDLGIDLDSATPTAQGTTTNLVRLSGLLVDLGSGPLGRESTLENPRRGTGRRPRS